MSSEEVKVVNPDSAILRQSEGLWQKYLTLIVWKLAPGGVSLTEEDIRKFMADERKALLTHGHPGSIEFKVVTDAEAEVISKHESARGSHEVH